MISKRGIQQVVTEATDNQNQINLVMVAKKRKKNRNMTSKRKLRRRLNCQCRKLNWPRFSRNLRKQLRRRREKGSNRRTLRVKQGAITSTMASISSSSLQTQAIIKTISMISISQE
jgi:hypothetical protein